MEDTIPAIDCYSPDAELFDLVGHRQVSSDPDPRCRVTVLPEPAREIPLPDPIAAAAPFGVAGHLPRAERGEPSRPPVDRLPGGGHEAAPETWGPVT
ncbi:hypothetical protein [Nocardiopsis metallicus]|uniref:Uncharacterized protein n=1 Tax=Nocardiopsis metallicus TaxID=179819 RepID=A0A840WER3_9ACTN|nr:hypothetical protein [Nocardiopsis metallicus]MBB5489826.1 hypothetical protein [Nocardiopsis metallicus]